ncbi:hypothetical protein QTP86_030688, partial [Hemibagrus guttatus]
LNNFFGSFEIYNNTQAQEIPPFSHNEAVCLTPVKVKKTLLRINPRKAPGPDNIPGRVLKNCAEDLKDVLTDIFNISQAVVLKCFKATTIIPVPKKPHPSSHNDYWPVALTPIIMMCFERLIMQYIKSVLPPSHYQFQFAYRTNWSTEDAISAALHSALTHLDSKYSYMRMLFLDFSSAFNTIIPQQLINKLRHLRLNSPLCNWVLDFLSERPQNVRVSGKHLRHTEHRVATDDTTVVGLITNNNEANYRS